MEIAPILSAYDVDIVVDFAITRVSCGKLLSSCSHLVSYTAPVKIVGVKGLVLRVFSKGRERERKREPRVRWNRNKICGKEGEGGGGRDEKLDLVRFPSIEGENDIDDRRSTERERETTLTRGTRRSRDKNLSGGGRGPGYSFHLARQDISSMHDSLPANRARRESDELEPPKIEISISSVGHHGDGGSPQHNLLIKISPPFA